MEFLEGKLREELIAGVQQSEIRHSVHAMLLVPFACGKYFSRETRGKFLQKNEPLVSHNSVKCKITCYSSNSLYPLSLQPGIPESVGFFCSSGLRNV